MPTKTKPPATEPPPPLVIVLDLATRVICRYAPGQLPALVIDTDHRRIIITAEAATLPHLSAPADLAEAAELFRARLATEALRHG